jgi:hypothetical protein
VSDGLVVVVVLAAMQAVVAAGSAWRLWRSGRRGFAVVVGVALALPLILGLASALGSEDWAGLLYVLGAAAGWAVAVPVLAGSAAVHLWKTRRAQAKA